MFSYWPDTSRLCSWGKDSFPYREKIVTTEMRTMIIIIIKVKMTLTMILSSFFSSDCADAFTHGSLHISFSLTLVYTYFSLQNHFHFPSVPSLLLLTMKRSKNKKVCSTSSSMLLWANTCVTTKRKGCDAAPSRSRIFSTKFRQGRKALYSMHI